MNGTRAVVQDCFSDVEGRDVLILDSYTGSLVPMRAIGDVDVLSIRSLTSRNKVILALPPVIL